MEERQKSSGKHTPGPWSVERAGDKAGFKGLSVKAAGGFIANLVFQLDDSEGANARLIACAPDLLEALEEAVAHLGGLPGDCAPAAGKFAAWRLVINKARGRGVGALLAEARQ